MDKITVTEVGRVELNLPVSSCPAADKQNTPRLPLIYRPLHITKQENSVTSKSLSKPNLNRFNVQSLRCLLKDDTLAEINKVKEQTEQRAYRFIKQELLRDMRADNFLAVKAQQIAQKIMKDSERDRGTKNLPIQIGKGRNYLSKIVKDFQNKQHEQNKIKNLVRGKLRTSEETP